MTQYRRLIESDKHITVENYGILENTVSKTGSFYFTQHPIKTSLIILTKANPTPPPLIMYESAIIWATLKKAFYAHVSSILIR